jgi:hypothetical protein
LEGPGRFLSSDSPLAPLEAWLGYGDYHWKGQDPRAGGSVATLSDSENAALSLNILYLAQVRVSTGVLPLPDRWMGSDDLFFKWIECHRMEPLFTLHLKASASPLLMSQILYCGLEGMPRASSR